MPAEQSRLESASTATWSTLAVATAGLAHIENTPPISCQDATDAVAGLRPALVLADGAGSSPASDLGARTLVSAMLRLANTLETQLSWLLDGRDEPGLETLGQFVELLTRHARGCLMDRAAEQCRPVRDLRCTLLLTLVGRERLVWLKVGDGEIVLERAVPGESQEDGEVELVPHLSTLGERGRGEFANHTVFVDERLAFEQVQYGSVPVTDLTGIALMSDGAAERLVAHDGAQVAGQLSHWLDDLRQGRLRRRDLVRRFYREDFCRGTSGDDRSIALASRNLAIL
ncbi:protein phosphatase 2C domain-containing protein [Billgrantia sp. LNSP4103-1]|uniref:protein phosphatase 2C domain-containing protein n=1 Tax=Billgrantia sp. LNSP4103-1 TaxID=3410266 RepID=UPI00403F8D41